MASTVQDDAGQQNPPQKLQIYSTLNSGVSSFWKDKYEKDAKKYWDIFYKKHQDRFFKDRHYLDKEWGSYFSASEKKVLFEVGCGAGNTIFPLIATYPNVFVHACDFSPRAVDLVKAHKDFSEILVNAFVCDLTMDDPSKHILPSSVDIVTMIFVLSAVSPEKMPLVLQNIKKVLKPNGSVLFRDYAVGDLAQERLTGKDQKISENFYVRGDGTRAYYFPNDFLTSLFKENGFETEELDLCCKQVENRSRDLVMNRRWVQAVFRVSDGNEKEKPVKDFDADMSESIIDMFGVSITDENETLEIELGDCCFKVKVLSKEYQHTCKSTGLMLWESARLMAAILARNPSIVSGKRVLELGCGCSGICSMAAATSAKIVVATDGDVKALELLNQNITSNLTHPQLTKFATRKLEWGNKEQIEAIKDENKEGFEVIIGTDVTYVAEAIIPLFATARTLISSGRSVEGQEPALILCHVLRRVDEPSILAAAAKFGFKLVDNWSAAGRVSSSRSGGSQCESFIRSWFPENGFDQKKIPSSALNIMYFCLE